MAKRQSKPEGYIAKSTIFSVLQAFEKKGRKPSEVSIADVRNEIKRRHGFEENASTISVYRSQYKKRNSGQPDTNNKRSPIAVSNDPVIFAKVVRDIQNIQIKWQIDRSTLRSALEIVLED